MPQDRPDLAAKVNDLEATVMLMGHDLDALTKALHEQERETERLRAQVDRLKQDGLGPLPKPEDDRPPHY